MRFYTGRRNATNKSCLFDAKFFEFEEFSVDTFFCSSIQPQHAVVDEFIQLHFFFIFHNNSKVICQDEKSCNDYGLLEAHT